MHFNEHVTTYTRPTRSHESKFHVIYHDMTKFGRCYAQVGWLNVSGTNTKDTFEKGLKLYKIKVPKNPDFLFLHYWWLLKDAPKRADGGAKKITVTKRPDTVVGLDGECDCVDIETPQGGSEEAGHSVG